MVGAEAGDGWDYEGCLMIAQVMVNRVLSGYWGTTLTSVLSASNQFVPWADDTWQSQVPTANQREAALDALNGATAFDRDVLYFCTKSSYYSSSWFQSLDLRTTYANTYFMAS
ncbi:cell wall hydrolase [Oscillospiraceae bacterium HV4-5-C5C]|nr:cell wall hydrolase [Oscillospiraceae bacterium HV4-5-C5C]